MLIAHGRKIEGHRQMPGTSSNAEGTGNRSIRFAFTDQELLAFRLGVREARNLFVASVSEFPKRCITCLELYHSSLRQQ